jgi:hypothetical protein
MVLNKRRRDELFRRIRDSLPTSPYVEPLRRVLEIDAIHQLPESLRVLIANEGDYITDFIQTTSYYVGRGVGYVRVLGRYVTPSLAIEDELTRLLSAQEQWDSTYRNLLHKLRSVLEVCRTVEDFGMLFPEYEEQVTTLLTEGRRVNGVLPLPAAAAEQVSEAQEAYQQLKEPHNVE